MTEVLNYEFVRKYSQNNFNVKVFFDREKRKFNYKIFIGNEVWVRQTEDFNFDDCITSILNVIELHYSLLYGEQDKFIKDFILKLGSAYGQTACIKERFEWVRNFKDFDVPVFRAFLKINILKVFVFECENLAVYDKVDGNYNKARKLIKNA